MKQSLIAGIATVAAVVAGYALLGWSPPPYRASRPITRSELVSPAIRNVYDAVRHLRRDWLSRPAGTAGEEPKVYIEMPCADAMCLRWVEADRIEEVHYWAARGERPRWVGSDARPALVVKLRDLSGDQQQ